MTLRTKKIIAGIVGVIFAIGAILSVYLLIKQPEYDAEWDAVSQDTVGTIIGFETEKEWQFKTSVNKNYPVIEYALLDGTVLQFTAGMYSTVFESYSIGQQVPITYYLKDPTVAFLDTPAMNEGVTIAIAVYGVFCVLVSVLCLRWLFKNISK